VKKLILLPLLFILLGCTAPPAPDTPVVPKPPQMRVLEYAVLGAEANVLVAGTTNVLCRPAPPAVPQMDAATCSKTAEYVRTTAFVLDKISDEAKSGDPWAVMRSKIALIGSTAIGTIAVPDPKLRLQITTLQTIIQQILEVK